MRVDEFALLRGATQPVTSKQTTERVKARDETKRDTRIHRDEEQRLLAACVTMNSAEHKCAGPAMHDRIIGALERCCRQGEMLRIQNRHVEWPQHQIVIPGANAKDAATGGPARSNGFDIQGKGRLPA